MSGVTAIRPYFRTHMNALEYREWKDALNFENIPSTLLDRSYHIETISGSRAGAYDQAKQDMLQDCRIRVFLKGFRTPADAVDDAMVRYDAILARVLDPTRRLGTELKNIYLQSMAISPLNATNDNSVILELNFTCLIMI
jgi:hypothetical protein